MPSPEDVSITIRVPLSRIETEIRKKHSVTIPTASVSVADGYLVFLFEEAGRGAELSSIRNSRRDPGSHRVLVTTAPAAKVDAVDRHGSPRRRRPSTRNRMRTRGWGIVAKTVNSKGQTVAIYEPFVEALKGKTLTRREQEAIVARVLRDNGNRPGRVSIDYYLDNTLEFLAAGATA